MRSFVRGGVVLGAVPSIAAMGFVLVRLEPDGDDVLSIGVLRARLAYGSADAPAPADLTKRARTLARLLRVVAEREPLEAIVRTSLPPDATPEDARAAGMLDALAVELDVPLLDVDAAAIDNAGDELAAEAAAKAWTAELDEDEVPAQLRRRALEAVAAVRVAAEGTEALRAARELVRRVE